MWKWTRILPERPPGSQRSTTLIPVFLAAVSGLAWTIAYLEILRTSQRDRWVGMPWFALALNLSWEVVHSVLGLANAPTSIQTMANLLWLVLDGAILVQYLRFHVLVKTSANDRTVAWVATLGSLVMALSLQIGFVLQFSDRGSWYSAFLQNLAMSITLLVPLASGGPRKGQSLVFGVSKALGTLAPTLLFGLWLGSPLVLILGVCCLVFDILYIVFWVNPGAQPLRMP